MVSYRRPHQSDSEKEFIERYIDTARPDAMTIDTVGNRIIKIGDSPILWACHTDTVHKQPGTQTVEYEDDFASLPATSTSNCLGADCTTGVFLMLEMIKAEIPGLYIFHRGEECGGVGANHIERNTPHILDGITHAIEFDRYGYNSVVTHMFSRTCSNEAAVDIAGRLKDYVDYECDQNGIFTDVQLYADIVPECMNLSVGYDRHHTRNEYQDVLFMLNLRDGLISADWSDLVVKRDPETDHDYGDWGKGYRTFSGSKVGKDCAYGRYDPDEYDAWEPPVDELDPNGEWVPWNDYPDPEKDGQHRSRLTRVEDLVDFIQRRPSAVAEFLDVNGITVDELRMFADGPDNVRQCL